MESVACWKCNILYALRGNKNRNNQSTDPPLNAPTGFRTGRGVAASANLREEVWKLRDSWIVAGVEETERIAGNRMRDAMIDKYCWDRSKIIR
jgi:hypothetical protein